MREFWSITWAFILAIAVHVLMSAMVVLGTMDWKPFKPPALTGMTIEAVMVDTGAIKQRRDQEQKDAEQAQARKTEQERREQELRDRKEREKLDKEEAEKERRKDLALKKRQEDLRLQNIRKRQQDELEQIRKQRADATRQRKIEEEGLKQLDALKQTRQRQANAETELQQQLANEQREFRAGQIATKGEEYYAAIQSQVTNNWFRPPTARPGLKCRLKIVQIPGGEVISAAIAGVCNADEATRRSLVAAVERAGSLPYRGFEKVFEREIDFIFTYDLD